MLEKKSKEELCDSIKSFPNTVYELGYIEKTFPVFLY